VFYEIFVGFLIYSKKMSGKYIELDNHRFIPHPFQFTNQLTLRCYIVCNTYSIVEQTTKKDKKKVFLARNCSQYSVSGIPKSPTFYQEYHGNLFCLRSTCPIQTRHFGSNKCSSDLIDFPFTFVAVQVIVVKVFIAQILVGSERPQRPFISPNNKS
jgi:hypothetical protein